MTSLAKLADLPKPETMLTYASILEKPKYDERGFNLATGEIIEAACAALRVCAALRSLPDAPREREEIALPATAPLATEFPLDAGLHNLAFPDPEKGSGTVPPAGRNTP